MGVRRKVFYPVAFSAMLFASSAMAKINPTAFIGVTEFFLKDKSKDIDMEFYSPTLGEVALETGLIENIRFHGPFEAGSKDGARDFTADNSKDPLWNVVKILFPSVNGQLGTVTGATTNFARHVQDPKIVALLLNYAKQVEDTTTKSPLKKPVTKKFAEDIAKAFESKILQENTAQEMDPQEKVVQEKMLQEKIAKEKSAFINIITPLLNHIRGAIEAEKKGTSLYPRHTTEQVIEAFFCYQFNTQDDIWKLIENLDGSIVDKTKPVPKTAHHLEAKDLPYIAKKADNQFNIDDLFDLSNADLFTSLTPYKTGVNLLNNGTTYFFDRAKNTYIKDKTFQDCVEMTMRHICNLLMFNPEITVRDFDLSSIQGFVTKQEAMPGVKNLYFENFQKFYEVQKLLQANAGDIGTRSLWNTVVGNLPNTAYVQGGSNEIKSGFVNLLKTFDAVFSLSLKKAPTTGFDAKKSWVEESLKTLFSALNPVYAYTINLEGSELGNELIGIAHVTVANKEAGDTLFSFNLDVRNGHTEVNQLTTLKKHDTADYANDIKNHLHVVNKGTAEESLLLLASPDLHQGIHPLYKLYSQPLSDNASKIDFLKKLADNYDSWKTLPSFKNNLPLIQSMVKNVLNGIGWEDETVVRKIIPVIKKLQENTDLVIRPDPIVHHMKLSRVDWEDISLIVNTLPKLDSLDLKNNHAISKVLLTDEFKSLKKLSFSGSWVKIIEDLNVLHHLEDLNLEETRYLKAIDLNGLTNLKKLNLSSPHIEKIENLNVLPNLEILKLNNTEKLKELSLNGLTSLKELQLRFSAVEKLEGLDTLANLEVLELFAGALKEVSLKGLTNLKKLSLLYSAVEGLSTLSNLEVLQLQVPKLKEVSLNGLMNLKDLALYAPAIEKIENLNSLSNLEVLVLRNTEKLKEISLSGLTNLKNLKFSRSTVEKIENLDNLSSLEILKFRRTWIKEISLKGLTNLKELHMPITRIEKIEDLDALSNLEVLDLRGTRELKEVSLKGLTSLKNLNFTMSGVEKIEGLDALSNLENFELKHTKNLKELSFNNVHNELNNLDMEYSKVSILKGLNYLPNIKKLNLACAQNIQELEFTEDNKDLTLLLKGSGIKNRNQIKGIEHLDEEKIEW